jgi:hypothetical protein
MPNAVISTVSIQPSRAQSARVGAPIAVNSLGT